jgi:type I restriction enzyme R subunit
MAQATKSMNLTCITKMFKDASKTRNTATKTIHTKIKLTLVIVVDMLLTGFDSKYLNTLYVDKNLKYHGLIQAFSRTNRVLNDTKPYGNILDFRSQQQDAVDQSHCFIFW